LGDRLLSQLEELAGALDGWLEACKGEPVSIYLRQKAEALLKLLDGTREFGFSFRSEAETLRLEADGQLRQY